jgi:CBS domain containing-hemolysin-like protein
MAARAIAATAACLLLYPSDAHASLLSEEAEDKLATFIALFVLFVVPAVLITLFWMVHILPEKIAHKRHHPQFEAIRTLCLLSLVFGGLLWPLAWLWAYSKPVMYKMAYGTDKHPDAHQEPYPGETADTVVAQPAATGGLGLSAVASSPDASLRERLARLEEKLPAAELSTLRADIDALEAKLVQPRSR